MTQPSIQGIPQITHALQITQTKSEIGRDEPGWIDFKGENDLGFQHSSNSGVGASNQRVEAPRGQIKVPTPAESYWGLILDGVSFRMTGQYEGPEGLEGPEGPVRFPEILQIRIPYLANETVLNLTINSANQYGSGYDYCNFIYSIMDIYRFAKERYDNLHIKTGQRTINRMGISSILKENDSLSSFGLSEMESNTLEILCLHDRILAFIWMYLKKYFNDRYRKYLLRNTLGKENYLTDWLVSTDPWVSDFFYQDGKPKY